MEHALRHGRRDEDRSPTRPDVEAGAAISAIIQELNAQTMKDMGKVMAALRERFAGSMDFGKASGKIKELLSGK